ncbi:hypothetical protein [Sphaerisporangium corydalis]|uniref:Uncharacterized protein n=1 Tax=Sphaerisporangium corydalis TaxID=1441875 RepID=A0ABV9EHH7_9ACTN|nr:hypothetical protein [Sphaerisporangium corydalis]
MTKKIRINLLHPTNSAEILSVAVSDTATPKFLIAEMIRAGFIPQPNHVGQYKLRNTRTGHQLLDDQALGAGGVTDNANLSVDHATTGASPEEAAR